MCGCALSVMLLTLAVVLPTPQDYSGTFQGGYISRFIASSSVLKGTRRALYPSEYPTYVRTYVHIERENWPMCVPACVCLTMDPHNKNCKNILRNKKCLRHLDVSILGRRFHPQNRRISWQEILWDVSVQYRRLSCVERCAYTVPRYVALYTALCSWDSRDCPH